MKAGVSPALAHTISLPEAKDSSEQKRFLTAELSGPVAA